MYQKYSLRFVLLFLGEKKIGKELQNLNFLKKKKKTRYSTVNRANIQYLKRYPEYEERIIISRGKKIGKELKNLNFLKKNTILLIEQIYNKGAVESYPEYEERIETEEEQFISLTTVPHENVWYEMLVRLN